ncbi:kinase-like domain-containing protein, partial [Neohortaea acidophila]
MFSGALKSFTSNITSSYTIAAQPSSTAGPWKIFDAKKKSTGKAASIFIFERRSLDPSQGSANTLGSSRSSNVSLKRAHDEVIERLKKEASSLARLRHPSILELAEPVEETRHGGLMFATEPVTASLGSLLQEKDEQERSGGRGAGKGRRFVVEETNGSTQPREFEIDELEIQKGLLQLAKGLEFLHESAGLVHANLTPEAILVNAKGDWKISGLSFCGPHETSNTPTSLTAISLSEVLNHDPRLPRSVQLDLDYTSPDFVLDNSLTPAADIFSLGLLIISLYNSPHTSPLNAGGSLSAYKRLFSSSSNVPTQHNNFLVPSSHPLPPKLASELLPRLITRRPAQRLSAREFQEASYFDNILVSTIRFLDALPAKTPNEKAQFMRGLPRILSQFPKSVLEKKVLPALLEEMKDRELLAPIIADLFAAVKLMPTGKRAFTEQVVPKLREVFVTKAAAAGERDTSREAGLMIFLENMETAAANCPGKEFREDILPILILALESPTHAIVDASLATLPHVLPVLDFSTIKNELFPVIANVFAKTSSLNIKIKGLDAFYTLCGGQATSTSGIADDDLNGIGFANNQSSKQASASSNSSAILDKFTVQEKIVPLLKGIKTKEPGVMMAALRVFQQVGTMADSDYLAMEVIPILWSMSLGPLLNLQQFKGFMDLIRGLGDKIEREQTRKLQDLRGAGSDNSGNLGGRAGVRQAHGNAGVNGLSNGDETDFESLVSGRKAGANNDDLMNEWGGFSSKPAASPAPRTTNVNTNNQATFSWQTAPAAQSQPINSLKTTTPGARTITPDQSMSNFAALRPSSTQYSQPLQPNTATNTMPLRPAQPMHQSSISSTGGGAGIDWSAAS